MSGGLQVWIASIQPRRRARTARSAVIAKERGVLAEVRERAACGSTQRVLVELDTLQHLVRRVTRAARADDGDPVSRLDQCSALEPDPPIERNGEVLDDDEHPAGVAGRVFPRHQHTPA